MSLVKKLNLTGIAVQVMGKPAGLNMDGLDATPSEAAEGILVFARTLADLETRLASVIDAAKENRVAWIAYLKDGRPRADLNRDILSKQLRERGVRVLHHVAINDVWSAVRLQPANDSASIGGLLGFANSWSLLRRVGRPQVLFN